MPIVTATGTARGNSFACGVGLKSVAYFYKYAEGSIVYVCRKASQQGILEAVAIKSVCILLDVGIIPLYTDTYNRLWNEEELCIQSDAKDLAIAYWENEAAKLQTQLLALSQCNG